MGLTGQAWNGVLLCFGFAGVRAEAEVRLRQTHVARDTLGVKQSLGRRIKIRDQPELDSRALSHSRYP